MDGRGRQAGRQSCGAAPWAHLGSLTALHPEAHPEPLCTPASLPCFPADRDPCAGSGGEHERPAPADVFFPVLRPRGGGHHRGGAGGGGRGGRGRQQWGQQQGQQRHLGGDLCVPRQRRRRAGNGSRHAGGWVGGRAGVDVLLLGGPPNWPCGLSPPGAPADAAFLAAPGRSACWLPAACRCRSWGACRWTQRSAGLGRRVARCSRQQAAAAAALRRCRPSSTSCWRSLAALPPDLLAHWLFQLFLMLVLVPDLLCARSHNMLHTLHTHTKHTSTSHTITPWPSQSAACLSVASLPARE